VNGYRKEETMELNSLSDVLVEVLGELYSAEQQLVEALPNMASAAHSYELREAFESHLVETRSHVERLEQAFADMGIRFAPSKTCKAMQGLVRTATTSSARLAILSQSTQH